jgi:hypothetical protein
MASDRVSTQVSVRFALPYIVERGATTRLVLAGAMLDNGQSPFTSCKVSVYDPSGNAIVSEASATFTQGVTFSAGYDWTPAATLALGGGYTVEWKAIVTGGEYATYRNDAMVVRRSMGCPIASADLYSVMSSLNPSGPKPIHGLSTLDVYVSEAWTRIQRRLIEQGNRPNLILSPSALHDAAVLLSLALVFEDFSTRLNAAYMEQARMYREQYETAWNRLSFSYADLDGTTASPNRRRGATSAVFLGTSRWPTG